MINPQIISITNCSTIKAGKYLLYMERMATASEIFLERKNFLE